jgi:CRP-like cAMP-binding protein
MSAPYSPTQNLLLSSLPAADLARLSPHLQLDPMPLGEVYYESGSSLQYVYFPITSIVSLNYVMENGASAEIACVGKEGILGISLFMGGNTSPHRASVRTAGYGYKMRAKLLLEEFNRAGSLQRSLLRYTQALITQASQTAVCNRHHSVMQQLCRWLLITLDRVQSNELVMTQELVAGMVGVRRESVADALKKLQQAGIILYRYGRITVVDRRGLEDSACECYDVVKLEFDRLLGLDWDWRQMPDSVRTWSRASTGICAQA